MNPGWNKPCPGGLVCYFLFFPFLLCFHLSYLVSAFPFIFCMMGHFFCISRFREKVRFAFALLAFKGYLILIFNR